MRKRDKKCNKATPDEPKRERRMSILLSEDEQQIVDRYLDKYKITSVPAIIVTQKSKQMKSWMDADKHLEEIQSYIKNMY